MKKIIYMFLFFGISNICSQDMQSQFKFGGSEINPFGKDIYKRKSFAMKLEL